MSVPRHRFHTSPHGPSGEWDRSGAPALSSGSRAAFEMFRLRSSNRYVLLCLSVTALALCSALVYLTAAHSSFSLASWANAVAVSEDDLSVDVITLNRHYPPSHTIGTPEAVNWVVDHLIFFLHIPKTAGQSFTTALSVAADPYRPILADKLAEADAKLGNKVRPRKAVGRRLDLTFMQRAELFEMLKEEKHDYFLNLYTQRVLVFGHTDVLIKQQFEADGRQVEFVTLLRSPEERVLSHFCYMQTTWNEAKRHALVYPAWFKYLNAKTEEAFNALPPFPPLPGIDDADAVKLPTPSAYPPPPMSPTSFVAYYRSTPQDRIDNWHTRAYAGCLHTPLPTTPEQDAICNSTTLMVAEAKRALRNFLFVGITEHYNQTLRLLNYTLNANVDSFWKDPAKAAEAAAAALAAGTTAADSSLAVGGGAPLIGNAQPLHHVGKSLATPRVLGQKIGLGASAPVKAGRFGRNGPTMQRKVSRVLNMNRHKSKCIVSISGNSTESMEAMMEEIRAIEWMDFRLYEYGQKLFWARVEEVEQSMPGFTLPIPHHG